VTERNCTNTGLLCGKLVGVDIDVLDPELAEKPAVLARAMLGGTPLVRIGRRPKLLLVYRTEPVFRRLETPEFFLPDDIKAQVEILAQGQQFVAFGVHPDTRQPYSWETAGPDTVPWHDLPFTTEGNIRAYVAAATTVIRENGGKTKDELNGDTKKTTEPKAETVTTTAKPRRRLDLNNDTKTSNDFFQRVNQAAVGNYDCWVPTLFPKARQQIISGCTCWRVSSADLHRDLQEDLSFHPDGIYDFGEEEPRTPIDVVMQWGAMPNIKAAAHWLCEQIGVDPADLGWKQLTPKGPEQASAETADNDDDWDQAPEQPLKEVKKSKKTGSKADWYNDCIPGSRGQVLGILANAMVALRADPAWQGVLAYDEMTRTALLRKPVPTFGQQAQPGNFSPRSVTDEDVTAVQEWLQIAGLPTVGKDTTHQAVDLYARECGFHPVRAYLEALHWDGTARLSTWLHDCFGVEDTPYSRQIGRMFLISMVARILKPGCKCDYMLVLEGPQGVRKSTACSILGGKWFSDSIPENVASKDAQQHVRGKWLIEFGELHALNKSETTALKAFITRPVEIFRPSYGRKEVHESRQCVFIGTTNKDCYLRDETGGRRFWPVKVGAINTERLIAERDQLFAEAVAAYRSGEKWWPDGEFEREHILPEQQARFECDAWEEPVTAWLVGKVSVTVMEVAQQALCIEAAKFSRADQNRLGAILERLGWQRGPRVHGIRRWVLPPEF
jgi:predicted P-loop ATPase